MRRVLVIRLGALGDFVQSFAPFAAIRAHHPDAIVGLLTTEPYADLGRRSPWFDLVRVDVRPPIWDARRMLRLAADLRGWDMVYDLQTSARTARYRWLAGRPAWSGIGLGASHRHANPKRDAMHTRERQREQLRLAGIADVPRPDLTWMTRGPVPELPTPYVLLVPGAAPHRPRKRWPVARFAQLARRLVARGLTPVVIGAAGESPLAAAIRAASPDTVDLTGSTTLMDVAAIAARARMAIGNDTGPMHLAVAVGCPSIVLFSDESDPTLTAPRLPDGGWPTILRASDLSALPVERVAAALP